MTAAELRLLQDFLANRSRVVDRLELAATALRSALMNPGAVTAERLAAITSEFASARAAYEAEFGRPKAELTAEERDALAWAERVTWMPWTRPKIAALCAALRRLAG